MFHFDELFLVFDVEVDTKMFSGTHTVTAA